MRITNITKKIKSRGIAGAVLLLSTVATTFSSCEKQETPLLFADILFESTLEEVQDTLSFGEEQVLNYSFNARAVSHPDYNGDISAFEHLAQWDFYITQENEFLGEETQEDTDFEFTEIRGLVVPEQVSERTVLAGDTVIFTISGKFEIPVSEDVIKVYAINTADTIYIPMEVEVSPVGIE